MAFRIPIRPVLAFALAGVLSACGAAEADPHRFESMAETVAAIPVEGVPARRAPVAATPVSVEVMSPHALWDARDGETSGVPDRMVAAAAPAMTKAVVDKARVEVVRVVQEAIPSRQAAPVIKPIDVPTEGTSLVQLGAYADEASARAAWTRMKAGDGGWALEGLAPVYEPTQVNGRSIVRLKTRAPGAGAAALCAAAGIDDPWCHRGG